MRGFCIYAPEKDDMMVKKKSVSWKQNTSARPHKTAQLMAQQDRKFVSAWLIIFAAAVLLDLGLILKMQCVKGSALPEINAAVPAKTGLQYHTGGIMTSRMAGIKDEVKLELYFDPVIGRSTGMHSLKACCFGGVQKEYYTSEMPWEFILYKFSGDIPTITLFEIDRKTGAAKFKVVVLDPAAEKTNIAKSGIMRYIKKLDDYMPGFNWQGDVTVEQF
jgi:hypothetical protein